MKILKKLFIIMFLSIIVIISTSYIIIANKATFQDSYQSVIYRKYKNLKNTNDKKIIIVGGSNAGFGIDASYLEKTTHYKIVNLGLHAGFGNLFNTELAKVNINQGDIILLAYEYTLNTDNFTKIGDVDLIMSGIDTNVEMYLNLPISNYKYIFGNLITYANKKYTYVSNDEYRVYSSFAFDEVGNMIYKRESCIMDYNGNKKLYGNISESNINIAKNNIDYLKKFKKHVEKQGANVYFVAPPIYKDAVIVDYKSLEEYKNTLSKSTGILFISDPKDYLYPKDFMYDTIYHCNSRGELKRSKQLFEDVKNYLEKDESDE